jgi:hypothetical protein
MQYDHTVRRWEEYALPEHKHLSGERRIWQARPGFCMHGWSCAVHEARVHAGLVHAETL